MTSNSIKVACSNCNLRELCMPVGLSAEQMERIDEIVATRRKIKRGSALFRNGETFTSLYAIRTGFFKTSIATEDGRDQVTGFQMAGEIIGLDGIVNDRHSCDAIALEDAEVCVMPYSSLEDLSREVTALQHHVHKVMSREIVREHGVMLLLGSMRAEERLAAFLLNLVQRLHARGFSQHELILRMTREEIGSYLGLKLETVSRTFSKFAEENIIEVKQRHVRILDTEKLQGLINTQACTV
ncbi:MAG: fumarate/nitrate reduction transcriptional regulator Fnr [Comamonas sp.]|jgi:CRP/FNR family transcriptional regulator|uniref:Fumarate/nitrate reduction transcriptional regulator Fnr n=1 Tax=Comamonas koreensis TaxID=160825 RepID=A0AAW4XU62_9BURK|nr:fumarate/nitrate reduction transcriptional regulator Fnr [Comamonas koreensis]MCD2164494.1 fumarate/nitrate reduction transcriptional regulator Fnr [Comamonas koreensis]MDR2330189.1 fumarate/nitrate reduction transcriptional regulator Fnr [Comamonas sp.]